MAQDYPNGLAYGATTPPYGPAHPHRGQDYLYPWGADINVEGTVIGKAGATGLTYDAQGNKGTKAAAHLHVQEWSGNVANVRRPINAFKGGTVTVVSQSSDFGNYVTIQNADGWNDTYCHLSEVNVKPGQVINPEEDVKPTENQIKLAYELALNRQPTPRELKDQLNQPDLSHVLMSLKEDAAKYHKKAYEDAYFLSETQKQVESLKSDKISKDDVINYLSNNLK